MTALRDRLRDYGAPGGSCVDLRDRADPRLLRYDDLLRRQPDPLVDGVVEQQTSALLYVIDHSRLAAGAGPDVTELRRRLAMRGDSAWLGVLHPGRMDIYATDLRPDPESKPAAFSGVAGEAQGVLPRLAQGEDLAPPATLRLRDVLLGLMTDAGEELRGHGLSTDEAIALTGRALFFRYLIGRRIVHEGHRPTISPSAADLESCFSTASSLAETNRWLDLTFNGDLLALPSQDYGRYFSELLQARGNEVTRPLCAILGLDTPAGPGASQRTLWRDLDFNHLPIGLLSETYERLIEHFDSAARRDTSVYYTPVHIAEYMVEEALYQSPANVRVLDPACGAGVFLVACFRKLAERHFAATGRRPTREQLRTILDKQLVGFDTNAHARTLAALALYLTALDLDPDPAPLEALRFDKLEGRVLIDVADPGSDPSVIVPMAGSLGEHVDPAYTGGFDLVIGNPPWTGLKSEYSAIDKQFTRRCRAIAAQRGLAGIADAYENPDKVPDLPFVWGAMEWAKPGGRIALALHGRWLFKTTDKGFAARRAIFQALAVTGILNGASLQGTKVWPNMNQPFCLLFADNRLPKDGDQFVLVSPEWEKGLNEKGRMRVEAAAAMPVQLNFVAEQSSIIKTMFLGSGVDLAIVEKIRSGQKSTVGNFWSNTPGLIFCQGYQIGDRSRDDSHLVELPSLLPAYSEHPYVVFPEMLIRYHKQGLQWPRSRDIYTGPIVLVRESNRAERAYGRAMYCPVDVAYSRSYYGFSCAQHHDGPFLAKYLLSLIHSQVFEYFTLMTSGRFGVERKILQLLDVTNFPFVDPTTLSDESRRRIEISASGLMKSQPDWGILDDVVSRIYGLSARDQQTIADTLATRAPFAASRDRAYNPATVPEKESFRTRLEADLADVLQTGGHRVEVALLDPPSEHLPWQFLAVALNGRTIPPGLPARWIEKADDLAASRITLLDAREPCLVVGLLDRYRYWTQTQARLLASDLLWQHGALLEARARQ